MSNDLIFDNGELYGIQNYYVVGQITLQIHQKWAFFLVFSL